MPASMIGWVTPSMSQSLVCRVMEASPGLVADSMAPASPRANRDATSEDRVAAVDQEAVAGVEARGVRGQVDGDTAEVLRLAPAAEGHALDHRVVELVVA